jgi:hypothetical protein
MRELLGLPFRRAIAPSPANTVKTDQRPRDLIINQRRSASHNVDRVISPTAAR